MKVRYVVLSSVVLTSVLLGGCSVGSDAKEEKRFDYVKYDISSVVKDYTYLGSKDADHEIVLAFDYSCPWCKKWMGEILPKIEKKYIENNTVRYISQPLVLLNENSLRLANVDANVRESYPNKYYAFQREIASESKEYGKGFGDSEYVASKLKAYKMDKEMMKKRTGDRDPIGVTRTFTRDMGVKYVPSVYVNGILIQDPFSMDEIGAVLKGDIREGTQAVLKK